MRVNVENEGDWVVHQPTRPDAVLNPGTSTSFEVVVDVPTTPVPMTQDQPSRRHRVKT